MNYNALELYIGLSSCFDEKTNNFTNVVQLKKKTNFLSVPKAFSSLFFKNNNNTIFPHIVSALE